MIFEEIDDATLNKKVLKDFLKVETFRPNYDLSPTSNVMLGGLKLYHKYANAYVYNMCIFSV